MLKVFFCFNLRNVEMARALLLGAPLVPLVLVFDGGPRSHGDELIVRTSRFFAEPARRNKNSSRRMKNELEDWRFPSWDGINFLIAAIYLITTRSVHLVTWGEWNGAKPLRTKKKRRRWNDVFPAGTHKDVSRGLESRINLHKNESREADFLAFDGRKSTVKGKMMEMEDCEGRWWWNTLLTFRMKKKMHLRKLKKDDLKHTR